MVRTMGDIMRIIAGLSGLTAVAIIIALVIIGGATWPGYSHVGQYISELGAVNAPYGGTVSWLGFLPAGVLMIVFALTALIVLPKSGAATGGFIIIVLYAFGYANSAWFPCDAGCSMEEPSFSQAMHALGGLPGYLLSGLALILLGLAARGWPGGKWLAPLGIAGGILAMVGFIGMAAGGAWLGAWQRLLEFGVDGWVLACSLYLLAGYKKPLTA